MEKKTKIVKCMKCKCEFESEVDKMGVPYNRLCEKHRKMTESEHHYKSMLGIKYWYDKNCRNKVSKLDRNVKKIGNEWVAFVRNTITNEERIVYRGFDENEVVEKRKEIVDRK